MGAPDHRFDESLGMDQRIHRRDFFDSILLGAGGALLGASTPRQLLGKEDEWTGYGGIGDYARSNGNTYEVMNAGHQIRDNVFGKNPPQPIETGEVLDFVVAGGGISGIATALLIQLRDPKLKTLILENHPIFGGEAKQNEFLVDGHRLTAPQGSDHFRTPAPGSFTEKYYDLIGIGAGTFEYQSWKGLSPEVPLGRSFEHIQAPYALYFGGRFGRNPGMWLVDPWGKRLEGSPLPDRMRAEILKYRELAAPGSTRTPDLDAMTMEAFLMKRFGLSQDTIRTFLTPGPGDGHGIGPDVLSAYSFNFASEPMSIGLQKDVQSFPGGNAGIARHIMKTLIPASIEGPRTLEGVALGRVNFAALDRPGQAARIRLGSTVVGVKHEGDPGKSEYVSVLYTRGGKLCRLRARAVVMAGGNWTTKHVVLDLPQMQRDAYEQFHRSPCMIANIALRNWHFLYKLGVSGAFWFEGLGSYASVRKSPTFATNMKTIGPDSPVVMTLKVLYCQPGLTIEEQQSRGREEILATSYRDYERKIRGQLTEMFSSTGFDARRDIAGIVLNRWGHAYASPQPGFYFGKDGKPSPRDVLRNAPFGRIAFANTDLAGSADHTIAIAEGERAAGQLLDTALKR